MGGMGGAGGAASGSMSGSAAGASGMGGMAQRCRWAGPRSISGGRCSVRHRRHGRHLGRSRWCSVRHRRHGRHLGGAGGAASGIGGMGGISGGAGGAASGIGGMGGISGGAGGQHPASAAWAAWVEQAVLRRVAWAAWAACRVEQVVLRRVAWAAWVAWVAFRAAWVVSRRSSSIPQRRYGATDCWTQDEHITIRQGCVWCGLDKTRRHKGRKGGFM